ncbi:MAG: phosphatidylcholine/phosphatidylserine synthase [Planctomycetota bacterium]
MNQQQPSSLSASGSRKKSLSNRWGRRRERARQGLAIVPSLLTLGNAVCGIAAIIKVAKIQWAADVTAASPYFWATNLKEAALLILLGMVFDMLDGRVARLTKTTSDFGGQLDSLSDAITFGVTPGVITIMANAEARFPAHPFWTKLAWVFGIAYAVGGISRLARFNVENDHDEKAHLEFKGLPSPAAAGVIATLVLLQSYLLGTGTHTFVPPVDTSYLENVGYAITYILPFVALGLGYLMVSKFKYVHVANKYLKGRKPFYYLRILLVAGVCLALLPEVFGALLFAGFALTGPILSWKNRVLGTGQAPAPPLGAAPSAALPPASPPDIAPQPATGT